MFLHTKTNSVKVYNENILIYKWSPDTTKNGAMPKSLTSRHKFKDYEEEFSGVSRYFLVGFRWLW